MPELHDHNHNHDHEHTAAETALAVRLKTITKVAELLQITNQIHRLALLSFMKDGESLTVTLNPEFPSQRIMNDEGTGHVTTVTLTRTGDQLDIEAGE